LALVFPYMPNSGRLSRPSADVTNEHCTLNECKNKNENGKAKIRRSPCPWATKADSTICLGYQHEPQPVSFTLR
jgi:hypothetical protein